MSHELEIDAKTGEASMAYTGATPWHGLGTKVDGLMTADAAIKAARLDWKVNLTPVYTQHNGEFTAVPKRVSVTRETDGRSLGIVSNGYKPVQNIEAFEFFDSLVDSGEAKYETAGSLSDGRRIWMTAKIGDTFNIAGEDPHNMYLLLVNGHDGTKALQAVSTMVRVVCNNTMTLGLSSAKTSWTLNHRKTLDGRVIEARDALALSFKYQEAFQAEVEKMLNIELSVDKFSQILADVLPEQKHAQDKKIDALTGLFADSPTIKGTLGEGNAFGAFNAVTEYTSHKKSQTQEARMISNIFGQGVKFRNDMRDALLASV